LDAGKTAANVERLLVWRAEETMSVKARLTRSGAADREGTAVYNLG
jgi:hypothetical protein